MGSRVQRNCELEEPITCEEIGSCQRASLRTEQSVEYDQR